MFTRFSLRFIRDIRLCWHVKRHDSLIAADQTDPLRDSVGIPNLWYRYYPMLHTMFVPFLHSDSYVHWGTTWGTGQCGQVIVRDSDCFHFESQTLDYLIDEGCSPHSSMDVAAWNLKWCIVNISYWTLVVIPRSLWRKNDNTKPAFTRSYSMGILQMQFFWAIFWLKGLQTMRSTYWLRIYWCWKTTCIRKDIRSTCNFFLSKLF